MDAVQLPDELWCHIASFLTHQQLIALSGLNRLFLDLALNQRYKLATYQYSDHYDMALKRTSDQSIARRARSVVVNRACFLAYPAKADTLQQGKKGLLTSLTSSLFGDSCEDGDLQEQRKYDADVLAIDHVQFLTEVTSLSVTRGTFYNRNTFQRFMTNAFNTFGTNLISLTMDTTLARLSECLPPDLDQLPSLKKLSLKIIADCCIPDADYVVYSSQLSRFIASLSNQLHHLEIDWHSPCLDPFTMLGSIGPIPRIGSFNFTWEEISPTQSYVNSFLLSSFIKSNMPTLEKICIPARSSLTCSITDIVHGGQVVFLNHPSIEIVLSQEVLDSVR